MPVDSYVGPIQTDATYSAVAAAEAAPASATDGVAAEGTETYWFISSAGGAVTATFQLWFYDNIAARWCKVGTTLSTTGNEVVLTYNPPTGSRIHLQATVVSGALTRNWAPMNKES